MYTAKQIAEYAATINASPRLIAESCAAKYGVEYSSSSLNMEFDPNAGSYYIHVNGATVRISDHQLPEVYAWQYRNEERYDVRVVPTGNDSAARSAHVKAFEAEYGTPVRKVPGSKPMTLPFAEWSEARKQHMAAFVAPEKTWNNLGIQ
jgi:archaellin